MDESGEREWMGRLCAIAAFFLFTYDGIADRNPKPPGMTTRNFGEVVT